MSPPEPGLPRPTIASWRPRLRARWRLFKVGESAAWSRAVGLNDEALMRDLRFLGASAKDVGTHVVMRAVGLEQSNALRELLAAGANPNARTTNNYMESALHRAALKADTEKVELLAAAGAQMDVLDGNGYSPLAVALNGFGERPASWEHRRKMVFLLLDLGAQASQWAWNDRHSLLGQSPIDLEVMGQLIARGASPDRLINPSPKSSFASLVGEPLLVFRASELESLEAVAEFLDFAAKHGQGPRVRGREGQPLLHHMLKNWNPSGAVGQSPSELWAGLLDLLEDKGHDLTSTDSKGNTAWHVWARHASTSFEWIADALMARENLMAIVAKANHVGTTPLDLFSDREEWMNSSPGTRKYVSRLKEVALDEVLPSAPSLSPSSARWRL